MTEQLEQEASLLYEKVCQGISDPKRILILYELRDCPRRVRELADTMNMPQPTLSRHLKILRDRSLVMANREGTSVTYSLAEPRLVEALEIMREVLRSTLRRESEVVQLARV